MRAGTVSITLDGSEEELRSLANWLRDEEDLRGRVRLMEKPIEEGAMGGVFDSILLVLGSAGTVTAFSSVKDWLVAKKSAQKITMRLKAESGRELELSCGSAAELGVAVEHAQNFFNESA